MKQGINSPQGSILRPAEDYPRQSLSEVLSREIGALQNQLNHFIVAKQHHVKQESNCVDLSDNVNDLKSSNDYLFQKADIFKLNNATLAKANDNLREQLLRYHKLVKQLEMETMIAEQKKVELTQKHDTFESDVSRETQALKDTQTEIKINSEILKNAVQEKANNECQIADAKAEVLGLEKSCCEVNDEIGSLEDRVKELAEVRGKFLQESSLLEKKLVELRTGNEFLKSEVELLTESLMFKELRNEKLVQEKEQLDALASEFYKLRISYTERLNEQVLARNVVIRRIVEDNNRLDSLGLEVDKKINQLKSILN